jgi:hypothetical protein
MSDIENNKSNEIPYTSTRTAPILAGATQSGQINFTNKKKDEPHPMFFCCGVLTLIGLVLGLIAAVVCYYYFGIKFLIDYKNENSDCNSKIWDYVLVSLIMSFVLGGSNAQNAKNEDVGSKLCSGVFVSLIWLGIGIWGIIETENENCEAIRNTDLWTFANVISIIQTCLGSILCLLWCCIGFCVTQQ